LKERKHQEKIIPAFAGKGQKTKYLNGERGQKTDKLAEQRHTSDTVQANNQEEEPRGEKEKGKACVREENDTEMNETRSIQKLLLENGERGGGARGKRKGSSKQQKKK